MNFDKIKETFEKEVLPCIKEGTNCIEVKDPKTKTIIIESPAKTKLFASILGFPVVEEDTPLLPNILRPKTIKVASNTGQYHIIGTGGHMSSPTMDRVKPLVESNRVSVVSDDKKNGVIVNETIRDDEGKLEYVLDELLETKVSCFSIFERSFRESLQSFRCIGNGIFIKDERVLKDDFDEIYELFWNLNNRNLLFIGGRKLERLANSVFVASEGLPENADRVLLAQDDDNEGEGIALEIISMMKNIFGKDFAKALMSSRIRVHSITPKDVMNAINNPDNIDLYKVLYFAGRTSYDFTSGYMLSNMLKVSLLNLLLSSDSNAEQTISYILFGSYQTLKSIVKILSMPYDEQSISRLKEFARLQLLTTVSDQNLIDDVLDKIERSNMSWEHKGIAYLLLALAPDILISIENNSYGRVQDFILSTLFKEFIKERDEAVQVLLDIPSNIRDELGLPRYTPVKGVVKGLYTEEDKNKILYGSRKVFVDYRNGVRDIIPPPGPANTYKVLMWASSNLSLQPLMTMNILQTLYEAGLITYPRTDANIVSSDSFDIAKILLQKLGHTPPSRPSAPYFSSVPPSHHEAIRPTSPMLPTEVAPVIYSLFPSSQMGINALLIYTYIVASFLTAAKMPNTGIYSEDFTILVEGEGGAKFEVDVFEKKMITYLQDWVPYDDVETPIQIVSEIEYSLRRRALMEIIDEDDEDKWISVFKDLNVPIPLPVPLKHLDGQEGVANVWVGCSDCLDITLSKLIKIMKELRIGRPSTYANIINTLLRRGYISIAPNNKVSITKKGIIAHLVSKMTFKDVSDINPAMILSKLDEIIQGEDKEISKDDLPVDYFYAIGDLFIIKDLNEIKEKNKDLFDLTINYVVKSDKLLTKLLEQFRNYFASCNNCKIYKLIEYIVSQSNKSISNEIDAELIENILSYLGETNLARSIGIRLSYVGGRNITINKKWILTLVNALERSGMLDSKRAREIYKNVMKNNVSKGRLALMLLELLIKTNATLLFALL